MGQLVKTPELLTPSLTPLSELGLFPPIEIESDEPELESSLHLQQIILLISCLDFLWSDRSDYFAAGNLSIYFKPEPNKPPEFRGPDFFIILGVEKRNRKSWVVYHEGGVYPHVIIEILSDSTAQVDRTTKKNLYQNVFRTPNYFWFDPYTLELAGFSLVDGVYEPIEENDRGHLWSGQLGLFLGIYNGQLRYFHENGELVKTPEETVETALAEARETQQQLLLEAQRTEAAQQQLLLEAQRTEEAQQQAQAAFDRANRLAAKLRELNIDPDQL
ncbi:MAG: Uma2 family endonuclease [Coleofasciculaceae cyanobacterium SM2_1_6]|nr:Uma2 family endonuclease [Coleofasciculaceae cyanobacterium SM2_1_6]